MNFNASLVDSFLTAAETAAEERQRARGAHLKADYGDNYDAYLKEIQPLVDTLSGLVSRPGETIRVTDNDSTPGFGIRLATDKSAEGETHTFNYSFICPAPGMAEHKVSVGYKFKDRSGHISPSRKPQNFADVGRELGNWIAEHLPHRLQELRDIAARLDDTSMGLDRSIKTGSPLRLKTSQPA